MKGIQQGAAMSTLALLQHQTQAHKDTHRERLPKSAADEQRAKGFLLGMVSQHVLLQRPDQNIYCQLSFYCGYCAAVISTSCFYRFYL